jgi:hypothetical protein
LNPFEINLIRFENRIGRTVLPTPPVSAAPTASLRHTQPLTTGPPSRPGPPVSHIDPHRADPAVFHCRAATRRPRAPWPGHCRANVTPSCCSTPCQAPPHSPSLSPALPPRGAHPFGPPSPPLPLKPSHRPSADLFLPPRVVYLARPRPSATHASSPPSHLPRRLFAAGAPPPDRTPSEHLRRLPPPLSAPPNCSFPQLAVASSPLGLPRATGPSHPRRRPLERPRRC